MAYTTINDPSAHFHIQLYTGTGSLHSITNNANAGDSKPDWIQIKNRSAAWSNIVFDSSRGVNKALFTPATDADTNNNSRGYLSAFNTDGFTVGAGSSGSDSVNTNGQNYVAWQWKANGGTTSTDTTGASSAAGYNTTIQVNQTAGFSIVRWNGAFDQGNGRYNLGHGLGKIPDFVVIKNRDQTGDWYVHHKNIDNNDYLRWNVADGTSNASNRYTFYRPDFTTALFNVDYNNVVTQNHEYIAYVFASIKGYSHFGSYTGNGLSNGPFIYTGFKPKYVWFKRLDTTENWYIYDSARDPINEIDRKVFLDASNAESQSETLDFVSNGIKLRNTSTAFNANGGTYAYAAFAEHPFVSSAGVPTTAR